MQPLLPKLVTAYIDPKPGDANASETDEFSGLALLRWLQLDSAAARAAVIRELLSPHPRFGNDVPELATGDRLPEIDGHLLQELAIQSLQDPDAQLAADAAAYLGTFGTTSAEAVLWAKLSDWSAEWKGREGELSVDRKAHQV